MQNKLKISIKSFEEKIFVEANGAFVKQEGSIIGKLGAGSIRQKVWYYTTFGAKSRGEKPRLLGVYYRDDRYAILH